jgi:hypothetical protein
MHRTLAAMVFVALLGATTPSSLLDQIWSLFSSFWSSTTLNSDEGIGWDPNGGSTPPEGTQSDEGIGWDPNGGGKS